MVDIIRAKLAQSSVTVTTTATALPATSASGRISLGIKNNGAATIYIGDADVTTANGWPLAANGELSLDVGEDVIVYAIIAADTANVRILEGV